jgi:hypothetical protein
VYGEEKKGDDDQLSHLLRRIARNASRCKAKQPLSRA